MAREGLLSGKNLGVDATTLLEANAALKSIVRRDNGISYDEHVTPLMKTEGIEEATPAQRQRFDRQRKKSLSNRDWVNPHDRQARITKMKGGQTQLAYKAEHAVDLETGAVVALTVQSADRGDTVSMATTLAEAGCTVTELAGAGVRRVIAEPERKRQQWTGQSAAQAADLFAALYFAFLRLPRDTETVRSGITPRCRLARPVRKPNPCRWSPNRYATLSMGC